MLQTIHDQITARLRSELLCGRLEPGQPLREASLADRYGVSRATVRQAFGQLVQEGLLVAKRNCGVRVAPPPEESVRDLLIPMRVMIEVYALRAAMPALASGPPDAEWARSLRRLQEACAEGDLAAVIERDFDFHRCLLVVGGQAELVPLWTTLLTKTHSFYRHQELAADDLPAVHAMHARLLDLFRAGDEPAAVAALSEHIHNGAFNERVRQDWFASKPRPMNPGGVP